MPFLLAFDFNHLHHDIAITRFDSGKHRSSYFKKQ